MALRSALGVAAIACLAAAAAGCGSGSTSSSTSSSPAPTNGSAHETGGTGSPDGTAKAKTGGAQPPQGAEGSQGAEGGQGGEGSRQPGVPGTGGLPPERSLETFGTEATGRLEREVAHAALVFLDALAKPDYARVCAGITRKDVEEFRRFQKAKSEQRQSCAAFLPKILPPPGPLERQAAQAKVTHVKVKGHDSIVFFAVPEGVVSYLPMIREGGRWLSVPVGPGTQMNQIGAG